jgi:hypothetical protein
MLFNHEFVLRLSVVVYKQLCINNYRNTLVASYIIPVTIDQVVGRVG